MAAIDLSPSSFVQATARIQRLSAGTLLNGWVERIGATEIVVRCESADQLHIGEKFFIELQKRGRAMFMAALTHIAEPVTWHRPPKNVGLENSITRLATFKVKSEMRFYDGRGKNRALRALAISIEHEGQELHAATTDVSPAGIGVLCSRNVPSGHAVDINIDTRAGAIQAKGVVRYSARDRSFKELFRLGIELAPLSPLDVARLMGDAAAA